MNAAPQPSEERVALAAGLVTVVMWGSAFVGIRAVAGALSPGSIAEGRVVVALIAFAAVARWRGPRPALSPGTVGLIAAFGALWFGLYTILLSAGEREVDAGTAVLIVNFGPILIALFSAAFLGERLGSRLLVGCGVALAGTALVASAGSQSGPTGSTNGVLLCLAATVAYAAAATIQRRLLRSLPAAWVNLVGALVAALVCAPFLPQLLAELGRAEPHQALWLVYLGLFPTALGFSTWAYALARTPAGRTAALNYLIPLVAILLSWGLLGEVPPALALAGGGAAIIGVAIARSRPRLAR